MNAARLHQRLAAAAALCALVAFTSGAGFDAPFALPAALLLLLATVWQPAERTQRLLEPALRIAALLLAARATLHAVRADTDVVAPMVDLLFLLLVAEALRAQSRSGAARLYALSFALLVAASAYRPGLLFGIAFTAFIVMLTAALVVGHIAREGERHARSRPATVPGRFVLGAAALSVVVLLTSAAVFLTFPRVSRTAFSRGEQPARSVVGFSDVVSLGEHGAVIESNPEIVLRVEFPDGAPEGVAQRRWRGRSYHRFDGIRWHHAELGPYRLPVPRPDSGERVRQLVYARTLPTNPIFGLHRIVDVQPRARIWPVREGNGDVSYVGRAAPVYLVTSAVRPPTPSVLRMTRSELPISMATFLQLPAVSERLVRLADSLGAGALTRYDRVVRIERYLKAHFVYTRELPRTAREASLDHFLFARRAGHCEYFSTAMVVLLRTLGIPARNVNGFLGGEWNAFGDFLAISQNNAHSWVEVWFDGIGWVEFDPTPAAAVVSAMAAGGAGGRWTAWMDGLEHRWNKWVLDYALEDQIDLLRRVAEPFAAAQPGDVPGADAPDPTWTRRVAWMLALLAMVLAIRLVIRLRSGPGNGEPTRSYRRLRHAYARAGHAPGHVPPCAFVAGLRRDSAPGARDAAAAVELYLRGRFGPGPLPAEDRVLLRRCVHAALAAMRQARGAWSPRRRALRS